MSNSLQPHGLQHARLPCHHQLPELAQTHVSDAIQPFHPLSSPSPPAFNLSQHWGLFQWVSSSHQVTKVLEPQLQHQSFQWIFRTDFLSVRLIKIQFTYSKNPCSAEKETQVETGVSPEFPPTSCKILGTTKVLPTKVHLKLPYVWAGRRRWHPTPVLLPGKSRGRRSLVGCHLWGHEESDTTEQLHFHFLLSCIEKEMAAHSSVLAWRIAGTGETGGLPSMGSHRVGHDWRDLAAAAAAYIQITWF